MNKIKVLMVGPARSVKGGMTTVVDGYFNAGLEKKVKLHYIETVNDKNNLSKTFKMINGFFKFIFYVFWCDIIHIHMASRMSTYRKGIYVRIGKFLRKKVVIHIHGAEYKIFYGEEANKKQQKYVTKTLSLADKIIVLSEEWKDYFETLTDKNKIIVLYNAIIIPNNFTKDLNNKNILFLGRIGKRKGIYDLLEVIKKLSKKYSDIKLYVGGDGEVNQLKEFIKKLNLESIVEYIGWTSGEKKDMYLKKSSIYILPSYNEGMPMSVLEGMAYKNVTISTYVGGIPKVINDSYNGLLINPGDKEKLSEKLENIFNDTDLRTKLSKNARKTVEEKFNAKKNVEKLIEIYESIR